MLCGVKSIVSWAAPSEAHPLLHLRRAHGSGASRARSGSLTYSKNEATVSLPVSWVQGSPQGFSVGQTILVGFTPEGSRLGQKVPAGFTP